MFKIQMALVDHKDFASLKHDVSQLQQTATLLSQTQSDRGGDLIKLKIELADLSKLNKDVGELKINGKEVAEAKT